MKSVKIIEFPSNLGLIEPAPGKAPGVSKLPAWLNRNGFYEKIPHARVYDLPGLPYTMNVDPASEVRNAEAIVEYAIMQARLLKDLFDEQNFLLVVGGDCSILVGNMLALRQKGEYGLFFLDGHTDFAIPSLSQTNGAAGMDLAIACGRGHEKLTNIQNLKPYVKEENTWAIGNRDPDPAWVDYILRSDIHYIDLASLRMLGMKTCANNFLATVQQKELDGFWIHFDVDVLDDRIMPAVDSRQDDGLTYPELADLLIPLLAYRGTMGLEITILDPDLDPNGSFTIPFIEELSSILKKGLNL